MSRKSHKLKETDSFRVFDDSQQEEEDAAPKETASIGVQTNFSREDATINTDVSLKTTEATDAEQQFYKEVSAYYEALQRQILRNNSKIAEQIDANKSKINERREEYAELFASLASKLEDAPSAPLQETV